MPDPAAAVYDRVNRLKLHALALAAAVDRAFPAGFDPSGESGDRFDGPLHLVAPAIDDVLAGFDVLQSALGLPDGSEPRHKRFLSGRCQD